MNSTEKLKAEILEKLRMSEAVYVLMSGCTRMPYVVCDAETYDDEILLYFTEEDARRDGEMLKKTGDPVQIIKVEKKNFLAFYVGLYPMGVNGILVNRGSKDEMMVQVNELIQRPEGEKMPDGKIRIENPELHLTALYFLQEMRKPQKPEMSDALKELNEEMMTHFQEGKYIVATEEGKGVPILKQKDGKVYQPIFTDIAEFRKFQSLNRGMTLKTMVIDGTKIPETLPQEITGVAVNPFGINLQLDMKRHEA